MGRKKEGNGEKRNKNRKGDIWDCSKVKNEERRTKNDSKKIEKLFLSLQILRDASKHICCLINRRKQKREERGQSETHVRKDMYQR